MVDTPSPAPTKPFFAFLLYSHVHHEQLWGAYLGLFPPGGYEAAAHCCEDYVGKLPLTIIPRVPSSWGSTMKAHRALFDAFLATDCTHWVLISGACIPVAPPAKLLETLAANPCKSLFSGLKKLTYNQEFKRSRMPVLPEERDVVLNLVWHEQWTILTREHVELLVANWDKLTQWFRRTPVGDNEHYSGVGLSYLGRAEEIVGGRYTYTIWPKGTRAANPNTIAAITPQRIAEFRQDGCLFARKFAHNTQGLELVYHEIGAVMPEQPTAATAKVLAHIHCFHPQHLKECAAALAKYPADIHLVVTYPRKNAECKAAIAEHCPTAEVLAVPNRGRDVAPFLEVLKRAKDKGFEFVVKIHTKDHAAAKDWRKGWRTAMLNALKDWPRMWAELSKPGVGLVGGGGMLWTKERGAFWAAAGDVEQMQLACQAVGIAAATPSPFFAGTIFAARWEAVAMWADAELPQFAEEPAPGYGTLAHGFERAFGAAALANGLKCVGI